jgi:cytidylate kinase
MAINYYPLINKIVSTLGIKDRLLQEIPEDHFFARPFITIAREPGSGGLPIAQELGKRLGLAVHDETIIDRVAESTKRRRSIIRKIDEKSRTYLEDLVHSALNPNYVDENTYIKELTKVILLLAHDGNNVIVGRGANFITPFSKGLHVNIVAPYKLRVLRAMKHEDYTEEKAKKVIAHHEKERRDFVKKYFKQDLNSRNAYDLTLNTTHYSIEEAAEVIEIAFRRKFPAWQRIKSALF